MLRAQGDLRKLPGEGSIWAGLEGGDVAQHVQGTGLGPCSVAQTSAELCARVIQVAKAL